MDPAIPLEVRYMKQRQPIKTVYYTDERNDEFSTGGITPRIIDGDYTYVDPSRRWRFLRFLTYRLIAMPAGFLYCKAYHRAAFRNRRLLKQVRGQGFFVYGNHTQQGADPFLPTLTLFPRSVYIIVHPDNVSMPVLGKVTPYLGALPLPSDRKAMLNFREAIRTRVRQGNVVMVYPEAHIWPYCTWIRDFPPTSMKFPVELDAPSFAMTTTYHYRRFSKRPRTVTWLDGPFYPNPELPPRARAKALRDQIYEAMVARSRESNQEYIRYEKKKENSQ